MRPSTLPTALLMVAALCVGAAPATAADDEAPETLGDAALFRQLDTDGDGRLAAAEVSAEHRRLFDRLVRVADADGDGMLTPDEFREGLRPSSGGKPIEAKNPRRDRRADAASLLLLKLDEDRDATLTRDEAPEALAGVFDRIVGYADGDKDDRLDFVELTRAGPRIAREAEKLAREEEWETELELKQIRAEQGDLARRFDRRPSPAQSLKDPARVGFVFERFDADGDNRITRAELPKEARQRAGRLFRRADRDGDGGLSRQEFKAAAERLAEFLQRRGNP